MPVAPSFQDLLDVGKAEARERRPDLAFLPNDVTVAQLHGAAAMADLVVQHAGTLFRETFFGGARGDALTRLVSDRTTLERHPGTAAQVSLTFARPGGGAAGVIPAGTQVASGFDAAGDQVVFTTDEAVSVGVAEIGPFTVGATAVDEGIAGNVTAGAITSVLDPLFETFTVTNPAAAAGGNDEETDEQLVQRARLWYLTLQKGTLAALELGALSVPAVRLATAQEDPATFAVTVLVSDADGGSSLQMVSDVEAALENWRCAGTLVQVRGGATVLVDLDIQLAQIRPGFDPAEVAPDIADTVAARMARLPTERTLFLDSVIAAVIGVAPDDIFDVAFTGIRVGGVARPIADVVPGPGKTLRAGIISVAGP